MNQQREAMRLAAQHISWEAFGDCRAFGNGPVPEAHEVIEALTAALALPDVKPAQQPLTDDQIHELWVQISDPDDFLSPEDCFTETVRAIEAAHGIKP